MHSHTLTPLEPKSEKPAQELRFIRPLGPLLNDAARAVVTLQTVHGTKDQKNEQRKQKPTPRRPCTNGRDEHRDNANTNHHHPPHQPAGKGATNTNNTDNYHQTNEWGKGAHQSWGLFAPSKGKSKGSGFGNPLMAFAQIYEGM